MFHTTKPGFVTESKSRPDYVTLILKKNYDLIWNFNSSMSSFRFTSTSEKTAIVILTTDIHTNWINFKGHIGDRFTAN